MGPHRRTALVLESDPDGVGSWFRQTGDAHRADRGKRPAPIAEVMGECGDGSVLMRDINVDLVVNADGAGAVGT